MEIKKNKKFYVIHFIYFSSMETDINFLLVLFPCLGADRLLPGGGWRGGGYFAGGSLQKSSLVWGCHFPIRDRCLGG